ncbi:hypothetical protein BDV95DRAFT_334178 [Massariosphaeria phaeospora]|uniref:Uncharacterized protein n=1 Tax=Massariosphaeria phaeospora TaxID=100035 RepID=A0A7C8IDN3_9PLEO|nr:hypothetical protein BDV95DRAFT_334178 [Massariosphaeria phaeospora]
MASKTVFELQREVGKDTCSFTSITQTLPSKASTWPNLEEYGVISLDTRPRIRLILLSYRNRLACVLELGVSTNRLTVGVVRAGLGSPQHLPSVVDAANINPARTHGRGGTLTGPSSHLAFLDMHSAIPLSPTSGLSASSSWIALHACSANPLKWPLPRQLSPNPSRTVNRARSRKSSCTDQVLVPTIAR